MTSVSYSRFATCKGCGKSLYRKDTHGNQKGEATPFHRPIHQEACPGIIVAEFKQTQTAIPKAPKPTKK